MRFLKAFVVIIEMIISSIILISIASAQMWDGYSWGANYGANVVGSYARASDRFYGASRATARVQYLRATRGAKLHRMYWKFIERGDIAAAVRVWEVADSYGVRLQSMKQSCGTKCGGR